MRLKTGNKKNVQLLITKKPIHAMATTAQENSRLQRSGGDFSTLLLLTIPSHLCGVAWDADPTHARRSGHRKETQNYHTEIRPWHPEFSIMPAGMKPSDDG